MPSSPPASRSGRALRCNSRTDVPVLLFVGRIQPLKGPDVAIRALHALDRPDAVLLIVGGASGSSGDGEMERAQQLVEELGLHDQVRFVAPQPHHILSTYYRAADVVVVPSRSESFGLVALEAAACGVPVVASAVGGLQSLVDHGETGFLIADRDPVAVRCGDRLDPRRPDDGSRYVVGGGHQGQPLHLEFRGCPPAAAVQRPHVAAARAGRMTDLHVGSRLDDLRARIDAWLDAFAADNPTVAAVDRGTSDDTPLGEPRWYVRMIGEEKDFITVWLTLGQRTLRYETYVMPAPEENQAAVLEMLLRRNDHLVGVHFSVGQEDAVYLRGEIPDVAVSDDELDRVLGTVYATVENNFRSLLRLAFASRFEP